MLLVSSYASEPHPRLSRTSGQRSTSMLICLHANRSGSDLCLSVLEPPSIRHGLTLQAQRADLVADGCRERPYSGRHRLPLEPHGQVRDTSEDCEETRVDKEGACVGEPQEKIIHGCKAGNGPVSVEEPAEVL